MSIIRKSQSRKIEKYYKSFWSILFVNIRRFLILPSLFSFRSILRWVHKTSLFSDKLRRKMRINNIWELNVLLCKHDDDDHVQVKPTISSIVVFSCNVIFFAPFAIRWVCVHCEKLTQPCTIKSINQHRKGVATLQQVNIYSTYKRNFWIVRTQHLTFKPSKV